MSIAGASLLNRSINYAASAPIGGGVTRAYISHQLATVPQDNIVGCWAASLSALFGAFGHPVNQDRIRLRYFPTGMISTGPPAVMMDALNTTWTDDYGRNFRITSAITNLFPPNAPQGPIQVRNSDIVSALTNETPVFYADLTHAMVLVQADYVSQGFGQPIILGGGAIDPEPRSCPPFGTPCFPLVATGFRQLQRVEMIGMFVGIPLRIESLP